MASQWHPVSRSLHPITERHRTAIRRTKHAESGPGDQFTSSEWVATAQSFDIQLSMAGKGRCYDNIHVERGWRSLKQEEVYLKEYITLADAKENIGRYIQQYNHNRLHQALGYKTPASVYQAGNCWNPEINRKKEEQTISFCV